MTAGYISAEAYSMLKPKARFHELDLNEHLLYPDNIATEIKQLFEDDATYEAICGLEQMEECLFNDDKRPYELLETLRLSSGEKVNDFLSSTGSKFFLLNYVFNNKNSLSTKAFINIDNIGAIMDFIIKYENSFVQLFTTDKVELNLTPLGSMSYNSYLDIIKTAENPIVRENSDLYSVQLPSTRMPQCTIDPNALSLENTVYKKYVVILSQLTDEEFEPFKSYFESQLANVSIRIANCVKSVGYHMFYVNYLFAKEEKLLSIRNFGKKAVYDFRQIRQLLIDHVINSIDYPDAKLKSVEGIVTAISEEIQQQQLLHNLSLQEIIGDTQYAILSKMLYGFTQKLSVRAKNAINSYTGDFIEDFVHKNKNIMDIKNIGKKSSEEILTVVQKLKEYAEKAKLKPSDEISPEKLQIMEYEIPMR